MRAITQVLDVLHSWSRFLKTAGDQGSHELIWYPDKLNLPECTRGGWTVCVCVCVCVRERERGGKEGEREREGCAQGKKCTFPDGQKGRKGGSQFQNVGTSETLAALINPGAF